MKLFHYTLQGWVSPADVFTSLFASDENAFWLDREHHPTSKFSIMGHAFAGRVAGFQEVLADLANAETHEFLDGPVSFDWVPGYVGWVEYPSEPLNLYEQTSNQLQASLLEVHEAIVFDHQNQALCLIGNFENRDDFDHWVQAILLRLALVGGQKALYQMQHKPTGPAQGSAKHSREKYLELIQKAKSHIASGDVYQLCLTNQISLTHAHDPLEVFMRLREQNPAPYSSYIKVGERALVSSSPEQFLASSNDGLLSTKPIKGTRARHQNPQIDAEIASELQNNSKERAENLMIVDLMRNDLSRVCIDGSVRVTKLFEVESYSTVHQLVSTVEGQRQSEITSGAAFESAFPGGSMTGAPKLRAQEIIRDLESAPRGVYSGVSGWFGVGGAMDLGMNIRCLVFDGPTVTLGVGGGITSDSDPEAEFEEIKLKARALLEVLDATVVW